MCFSVPIEISHSNVIVICCLSHLHLKSKEFGHLDTKDCEQTIIRLLSLGKKKILPHSFTHTHTQIVTIKLNSHRLTIITIYYIMQVLQSHYYCIIKYYNIIVHCFANMY